MKRMILMVLILFLLGSCSISGEIIKNYSYTKEDFDNQQYHQDRYQCEQDSYLYAAPVAQGGGVLPTLIAADRRVSRFEQCMKVKGYYRIK